MKRTMELRLHVRYALQNMGTKENPIMVEVSQTYLQQKWIHDDGTIEWKDIPVVNERKSKTEEKE
jgi:hypothetical protein